MNDSVVIFSHQIMIFLCYTFLCFFAIRKIFVAVTFILMHLLFSLGKFFFFFRKVLLAFTFRFWRPFHCFYIMFSCHFYIYEKVFDRYLYTLWCSIRNLLLKILFFIRFFFIRIIRIFSMRIIIRLIYLHPCKNTWG